MGGDDSASDLDMAEADAVDFLSGGQGLTLRVSPFSQLNVIAVV